MYDIYLIENKVNGKKYVGYTSVGYKKRFSKHLTESLGKSTRILCRAIRKYGKDKFVVSLIETVDSYEEAIEKEKFFIKEYRTCAYIKGDWGYNSTSGGEGVPSLKVSKEFRKKVSEARKSRNAWVGSDNPNYGKGHLMKGENHFLFGKKHSEETKKKISSSRMGKYTKENNPSSVKEVTFAKNIKTGEIIRADCFSEMAEKIKSLGYKFNRSSVLRVIRSGKHSIYGHVFYRKDITDKQTFDQINYEYENNLCILPELPDYGKGEHHPNAKNMVSFAVNKKTKEIFRFESWHECKKYISDNYDSKINYSEMYKVLTKKAKSTKGFVFYRADINADEIPELEKEYLLKTFND